MSHRRHPVNQDASARPLRSPGGLTRVLGVDYGHVRIGLAVSDPNAKIASPLATYSCRTRQHDADYFRQLVEKEEIAQIVLGLPVRLDGTEGEKAGEARQFGKWLREATGLPLVYWDERFSTVEAEGYLRSARLTHKRRKTRRDQVAAQILLQSYLDAGCPGDQPFGPLGG